MEHKKKKKKMNEPNVSKFVTRKWNMVNDKSDANHDLGYEIVYNTESLIFVITTMLTF